MLAAGCIIVTCTPDHNPSFRLCKSWISSASKCNGVKIPSAIRCISSHCPCIKFRCTISRCQTGLIDQHHKKFLSCMIYYFRITCPVFMITHHFRLSFVSVICLECTNNILCGSLRRLHRFIIFTQFM